MSANAKFCGKLELNDIVHILLLLFIEVRGVERQDLAL